LAREGEAGLIDKKPIPKSWPNQIRPEVVEKVLYLRRTYHLGPQRIVWYLERYHGVMISGSSVFRVLQRNGLSRLPRKAGRRTVHTRRYAKQVPGHHIQVDVKFLNLLCADGRKTRRYPYTAIDDATRIRLPSAASPVPRASPKSTRPGAQGSGPRCLGDGRPVTGA
jgi:hypothetical protein